MTTPIGGHARMQSTASIPLGFAMRDIEFAHQRNQLNACPKREDMRENGQRKKHGVKGDDRPSRRARKPVRRQQIVLGAQHQRRHNHHCLCRIVVQCPMVTKTLTPPSLQGAPKPDIEQGLGLQTLELEQLPRLRRSQQETHSKKNYELASSSKRSKLNKN
eukprot:Amastigsp_a180648_9.p4 type:complete len:161 gc:universal Amastigsp_a180648_9:1986-2468(+)